MSSLSSTPFHHNEAVCEGPSEKNRNQLSLQGKKYRKWVGCDLLEKRDHFLPETDSGCEPIYPPMKETILNRKNNYHGCVRVCGEALVHLDVHLVYPRVSTQHGHLWDSHKGRIRKVQSTVTTNPIEHVTMLQQLSTPVLPTTTKTRKSTLVPSLGSSSTACGQRVTTYGMRVKRHFPLVRDVLQKRCFVC